MDREEEKVRDFYDHYGWVVRGGVSGEHALFREFSRPYYSYHDGVAARTMDSFADLDGQLLLAGGGDLPEIHVTVARKFSHTTCVDISKVAIDIARNKLENKGEFIVGSILEIPKPDASFDAVYCAHVIYHIDKDQQEKAVRELIRVTKPGGRIVVIYSNPDSLPKRIAAIKGRLPLLWKLRRRKPDKRSDAGTRPPLYFFAHPLSWWAQFDDECEVQMKPWDVMGNREEETLLINDMVASVGYRLCAWLESRYPDKAAHWWSYPLILLTKRSGTRSSTS
jgi:SAM-dependent methyltransferase